MPPAAAIPASLSPPRNWRDSVLACLVWLCTATLYFRAFAWVADKVAASRQIGHALLTLGLAAAFTFRDHPLRPVPEFSFNRVARRDLFVAYLLAAGAIFINQPLLMIPSICLVLSAALLFIWNPSLERPAHAVAVAFGGFLFFAIASPQFDWPLRAFAGSTAAWLLGLVGSKAQLLLQTGAEPKLLLATANRIFEVAPECNGFGMTAGSVVLAILLVFVRPLAWFDKILGIAVAALSGLLFNSARILVIVLLAPRVGDRYQLMHEIVGIVAMVAGLLFVWWLLRGLPAKPQRSLQ